MAIAGPTSLSIPANHLTELTVVGNDTLKLPPRIMPSGGIKALPLGEKSAFFYQQAMDNLALARYYAMQK